MQKGLVLNQLEQLSYKRPNVDSNKLQAAVATNLIVRLISQICIYESLTQPPTWKKKLEVSNKNAHRTNS